MDYLFGPPFIPISFYLLSSYLLGSINKNLVRIGFLWATLAMLPMIFFTKDIVTQKEYTWGRFLFYKADWIGVGYTTFLLVPFFGFLAISFLNLYRGWRTAVSPRDRSQRRNVLIAALISYTGAIDFATGFNVPVYPFGYISLTLFIGIVAYTIVRHQFFEINILLKKFSLILLIYSFLLAFMFPLTMYLINQNLPNVEPGQLGPLLAISVLIGVTLAVGPLIYATLLQRLFWLKNNSSMGLAHELKSPLATIQGITEALLQHHSQSAPDQTKTFDYLHIIQRNTERLELFVQDLLKIAQIQDDAVVLLKSSVDISKMIKEVAATFDHLAQQKNVRLSLKLNPVPAIEVDETKIRQVVSNLISNALKFTSQGSVTITANDHGNYVSCAISDSGSGIAKADIERVFTRFFHGKNSSKGSGLGLAIAKAWVEAHGGKIWAESDGEGKGATVTFTLPVNE